MNTQVPSNPMSTQAENELICERLLAWKRCPSCGEQKWYSNYDRRDATSGPFLTCVTPSFTTWAEAGLILEALQARHERSFSLLTSLSTILKGGQLDPEDVRAAALVFIGSSS